MSIGAIVKGQDLFASLTPEEVHNVSRFSSVKKYERGDIVYRAGTPASHLFVLLKGRVLMRLPSQEQETGLVFSKAGPGDFLGLAALAGSERYTVTASCLEASEIQVIEVRPFRELLDANPRVGFQLMSAVAKSYCERSVGVLQRLQAIVSQIEFVP
ncbi:MAG TPA: cyclic nucleotide-binding domain-containing protein [Phycisphaerae bacterium]|nr:cyclic nucleotide-binding domain-containing protein [Phycisphaerae bacterium]